MVCPPKKMNDLNLIAITIERVLQMCSVKHHVGTDLVLCNFDDIPMPEECRQMECTFVGVCLSGEGTYSVGTVKHNVKPNDVLFIGEGQVLGDIKTSKGIVGEAMLISHSLLYEIIHDVHDVTNLFVFAREHPVISLTSNETTMFKDYLSMLAMKMDDESHLFRRQIAGTILATMVYELCNITRRLVTNHNKQQSKSQDVFEKFVKLVEQNFRHERRVSWYSEQLGISPKTLLEMVKRVSQRTPNEWLDIYTTLEIRLLLRHTSKSIKEIADELHFGTQSSLGKFFREHVGISPSNYRQS